MARLFGEFDRIDRYFRPLATDPDIALGLGDDAAILPAHGAKDRVISTDTMVEGVHFLPRTDPHRLAQKLLRVNLSDMAAMGAKPLCYFLSISLPDDILETWLHGFSDGLLRDQTTFGLSLAGGDSTRTDGPLVLTITIVGEVTPGHMLRRDGGQAGDIVFVSGYIGDGHLGLMAAQGGLGDLSGAAHDYLVKRYELPNPRVTLGQALVQAGILAGLDVSDGLVADLGHLCQQSGLTATIDMPAVPLSVPAREALAAGYVEQAALITGGDDYELVFAVPPDQAATIQTTVDDGFGPKIHAIGRLEPAAAPSADRGAKCVCAWG
ncbi:MAG: thiamine-phosphate kinase [Pseudomonadota bacterium]